MRRAAGGAGVRLVVGAHACGRPNARCASSRELQVHRHSGGTCGCALRRWQRGCVLWLLLGARAGGQIVSASSAGSVAAAGGIGPALLALVWPPTTTRTAAAAARWPEG